jgi:hypothetical protein
MEIGNGATGCTGISSSIKAVICNSIVIKGALFCHARLLLNGYCIIKWAFERAAVLSSTSATLCDVLLV